MIGKALKNVRSAVTKAAKPAPRTPAPRKQFMSDAIRAGGFGAGFGGGAGVASPATDLSRAASAAATPAASVLRSGKATPLANPARSMMKKGGAVKKTAAKKGKK